MEVPRFASLAAYTRLDDMHDCAANDPLAGPRFSQHQKTGGEQIASKNLPESKLTGLQIVLLEGSGFVVHPREHYFIYYWSLSPFQN
jgi:hypothetical protein